MDETDEDLAPLPWTGPPRDVLPGATGAGILLGRGPDTVVALNPLRCFPTGVELTITVRTNHPVPDLYAEVIGRHPLYGTRAPHTLHWAVRLADGTVLSADDLNDGEPGPTLTDLGSEGTDDAVDATYWLTPLPAAGPLTVVCSWPEQAIPETTTSMDVGEIRAAAARSLPLLHPTS